MAFWDRKAAKEAAQQEFVAKWEGELRQLSGHIEGMNGRLEAAHRANADLSNRLQAAEDMIAEMRDAKVAPRPRRSRSRKGE